MGIFSRNRINENKVKLFVQSLFLVAQSDDDFSEEEQNFLQDVILKLRSHYNYHKDIKAETTPKEISKTVNSLVIEDKRILMNILMEAAEADKVLKFKEIGAMIVVGLMINLDMEGLKSFFLDKVKEYKLNEKLFDEYYTIFLEKGKDAANEHIKGKNEINNVDSSIIFCPNCGTENNHDNKFCINCGKTLDK